MALEATISLLMSFFRGIIILNHVDIEYACISRLRCGQGKLCSEIFFIAYGRQLGKFSDVLLIRLCAAQVVINGTGGFLTMSNGCDKQSWAESDVSSAVNSWNRSSPCSPFRFDQAPIHLQLAFFVPAIKKAHISGLSNC